MRKCPNCGRNYSDMVQVCPACNITLDESNPGPKSAVAEYPREERAETTVRAETVVQEVITETSGSEPTKIDPAILLTVILGIFLLAVLVYHASYYW